MFDERKKCVAALSIFIFIFLFPSTESHFLPYNSSRSNAETDDKGAVAGRIVSIPSKVYRQAFKAPIKLGQCPLVMLEGSIKTCSDEFEGSIVHLAKGGTTVDVTRVQTSEDILKHGMGSVGASLGVLGLVSASPKITVAVTTETGRKALNLLSSYELNKGVITLHDPVPRRVSGDGALFLSEIELGGNEMILITLEFQSERQRVEVEVSVTFTILFVSMTAKLKHVRDTVTAEAGCRIQFKSSWRKELDIYYSRLDMCIPKVEEIEKMYMSGPAELRAMSSDDERSHYFYYFSSWKESPYGKKSNLALINHDLEYLTGQVTELKGVVQIINKLSKQMMDSEVRKRMLQLNETVTEKTEKLTSGLNLYHTLSPSERQDLRDVYGKEKPPHYYERWLRKIVEW